MRYLRTILYHILQRIATENRKIGQHLGDGKAGKKAEVPKKEVYESQKKTLAKYRDILKKVKAGSELLGEGLKKKKKKLVRIKRGRGRPKGDPVVYYENSDQLVKQLYENLAALRSGNNGVYNTAVGILDELLKIKAITKKEYDEIYSKFKY